MWGRDRRAIFVVLALFLWTLGCWLFVRADLNQPDEFVTPDHTRSESYWQGYRSGDPAFPRVTPPMTADEMEALCLTVTSRLGAQSRPQAMGGCIDALVRTQTNNERRFES